MLYSAALRLCMLTGKLFYAAIAAGIAFIVIGAASSIYSVTPVDVALDYTIRPGASDVLTPDMNVGSAASITVTGSKFDIKIKDPDRQPIWSESNVTSFSYDLTAQRAGEYRIEINNTGSTDLTVSGHAQTKASLLGLSGALMLVVTGIIVIGLGLRFRKH
ncbi:MAG: emp24/gp25L/p24 family protein [Thaumarchaeota archaeon]|nr:MAG: emp24/gp25L/p24 family protein [Nitrososphaerota archaeon]